MSDVMFFGVLRMPYEMAMADDLSRYQFYTRAQEAADRVEKAERELSERAVSPAESVQSVDTPEFREKLNYAIFCHGSEVFVAIQRLVAHIDAKLALAREEGCAELRRHDHEQACRVTHALMAERDDMRQRAKTAHAEGRRSAMEELHPQWLEEKERAEELQARLDAALSGKLAQATAKPLQQEGGKEDRRHHEEPDGPNHPGHHDGHTCEAMGQMLADFGSQLTTPEEVVAAMHAKRAASTTQVEPATPRVTPEMLQSLYDAEKKIAKVQCDREARYARLEAAGVTDAGPKLPITLDEVIAFIGSHYDYMSNDGIDKADWRYKMSVHDLLSAFRDWQEFQAAQATPEGRK